MIDINLLHKYSNCCYWKKMDVINGEELPLWQGMHWHAQSLMRDLLTNKNVRKVRILDNLCVPFRIHCLGSV